MEIEVKNEKSTFFGNSPCVLELLSFIHKVANSKANVLILGESGTGKELVARMIHENAPFADQPFIPVNCGAISENLMEAELFGYEKGSFTGALNNKIGLFDMANHGTLFLDEVGELSLTMQVKLLRALQERIFRRVGGISDIHVDVRVIAATNRNLEKEVKNGMFREDLYYRLNVILIKTPSLRERKSDIKLLAENFLKRFSKKAGKNFLGFEQEAIKVLENHSWPGNVRELENCIERAVTVENTNSITLSCFLNLIEQEASEKKTHLEVINLPAPNFSRGKIDLEKILHEAEKIYLIAALKQSSQAHKEAAKLLGLGLRSFNQLLKKHGIH